MIHFPKFRFFINGKEEVLEKFADRLPAERTCDAYLT